MVVIHTVFTDQVAPLCEVSERTQNRVLAENKFHPYKLIKVHRFSDDDTDRRLELCENMFNQITQT